MKINLRRNKISNKNDYGHALIIAGSRGMSGAAYMAAKSALISGAGKVTLAVPESIYPIIAKSLVEVMTMPLKETSEGSISFGAKREVLEFMNKVDVIAVGPGITVNASTREFVRAILKESDKRIVLDADGINCISGEPSYIAESKEAIVLTPHEGEFARLISKRNDTVNLKRKEVAKNFAHEYDCTLVLKGHRTIVAEGGGRFYVNRTGNPGLATPGSGDVLTGIIAAFIAQGFDPFFASSLAVYVHGLAGDYAKRTIGQTSMIASDIIGCVPKVLKRIEKKKDLRTTIRIR